MTGPSHGHVPLSSSWAGQLPAWGRLLFPACTIHRGECSKHHCVFRPPWLTTRGAPTPKLLTGEEGQYPEPGGRGARPGPQGLLHARKEPRAYCLEGSPPLGSSVTSYAKLGTGKPHCRVSKPTFLKLHDMSPLENREKPEKLYPGSFQAGGGQSCLHLNFSRLPELFLCPGGQRQPPTVPSVKRASPGAPCCGHPLCAECPLRIPCARVNGV